MLLHFAYISIKLVTTWRLEKVKVPAQAPIIDSAVSRTPNCDQAEMIANIKVSSDLMPCSLKFVNISRAILRLWVSRITPNHGRPCSNKHLVSLTFPVFIQPSIIMVHETTFLCGIPLKKSFADANSPASRNPKIISFQAPTP